MVAESAIRFDFDGFEATANIPLGEFEHLTGAAMPKCHVPESECLLGRSAVSPILVKAIDEKFRRDSGFLIAAKGVNWLPLPGLVNSAFAHLLNEFKLDERTVQVVLLYVALSASRWDICMKKRLEMLLQGNVRKRPFLLLGFLPEGPEDRRPAEFRLLPEIEQIVPRE